MRIFEFIGDKEVELRDGDRLLGIYVPGVRYTLRDDGSRLLALALEQWLKEGVAKIVEEQPQAAGPAMIAGQGEIK